MLRRGWGLVVGPGVFVLILVLPTPAGASPEAMRAAAVTCLMAVWWVTEAIPISATALIPVALFPLMGILDAASTAENYGHNYVLMLLGGFFLAKAVELQQLHRRIALGTLKLLGHSRRGIVFSFMLATALLSMWIANVAVTLLMLPIALAMVAQEESSSASTSRFGLALMLAIAYAASIGGTGTLIGTPPNMVLAGMIETLYPQAPEISFLQWMLLGIPLVLVLLPVTWLYLLRYFGIRGSFPGSRRIVADQLRQLGPMSSGERRVAVIFALTALGWVLRRDLVLGSVRIPGWASILGVDEFVHDSTVALATALLLFVVPTGNPGESSKRLLDWKAAERVPWGVVVIVGGGYAIARSFAETGLASWIGQQIEFLAALPTLLVVLLVVGATTFLTEINSNTATANIFLPVLATMAVVNGIHPFLLMIPATIACSCAFCLPSGTGTNAVVFASGRVTIPEMARCGFLLNFITIVLVTLVVYLVGEAVFGLAGEMPGWVRGRT